jgi:hypothetical protein
MRTRTRLLSRVAAVLVAATGSGNVAFAQLDDYRNCEQKSSGKVCHSWHSGTFGDPINSSIFNLGQLTKDQTAIVTNIGSEAFDLCTEQGLRFECWKRLQPGDSVSQGPFDNGLLSWSIWSIVIKGLYANSSNATVFIKVNDYPPGHDACTRSCSENAGNCRTGCQLDPHTNALCLAGCDSYAAVCMNNCPH